MSVADPPSYMFAFKFPPDDTSLAPGAQYNSIDEAIDAGAESGQGTRSILDTIQIQITSEPDYSAACPLSPDELVELFGSVEVVAVDTVCRPEHWKFCGPRAVRRR